jgi:hypothetical protein
MKRIGLCSTGWDYGAQVQVMSQNYDETMILSIGHKHVQLGNAGGRKVWVQVSSGGVNEVPLRRRRAAFG